MNENMDILIHAKNIINDQLPIIEDLENTHSYKPVQFYPTNPTDFRC